MAYIVDGFRFLNMAKWRSSGMMRSNTYALGERNQGFIFFGKVSGKTRDDTVYNLLEKIVFFENHE